MEFLTSIWFIGLLAFAAGAGATVLFYQVFASDDNKSRKLEDQLARVEQDFDLFKERVDGHFNQTAQLMEQLTTDYVSLYRHLADGAQKLADAPQLSEQHPQLLSLTPVTPETEAEIAPPKDYAAADQDDDTETGASDRPASTKHRSA